MDLIIGLVMNNITIAFLEPPVSNEVCLPAGQALMQICPYFVSRPGTLPQTYLVNGPGKRIFFSFLPDGER